MKLAETAEDALKNEDVEDSEEDLLPRPPVVTIMGPTSTTARPRCWTTSARPASPRARAGGITQHIGAYTVEIRGQKITFLDTPGHEAFTRHARPRRAGHGHRHPRGGGGRRRHAADHRGHQPRQGRRGCRPSWAINKMDNVGADPERIKQQLTEYGLVTEEWGGDTIMVPVSAVTGQGVDQLLEMILLVAEVQDYRANPDRKAARHHHRSPSGQGPRPGGPRCWSRPARCAWAIPSSPARPMAACAPWSTTAVSASRRRCPPTRWRSSASTTCPRRATSSPPWTTTASPAAWPRSARTSCARP